MSEAQKFMAKTPVLKQFPAGKFPSCPNCGNYLSKHHYKHCSDCGQAIQWPEYDKESENAQ